MSPNDPADRHFRVEERPFEGLWSKAGIWLVAAGWAAFGQSIAAPSRVCVVRTSDGTVVLERRRYVDDRSAVEELEHALNSSTVREFIQLYNLDGV